MVLARVCCALALLSFALLAAAEGPAAPPALAVPALPVLALAHPSSSPPDVDGTLAALVAQHPEPVDGIATEVQRAILSGAWGAAARLLADTARVTPEVLSTIVNGRSPFHQVRGGGKRLGSAGGPLAAHAVI
jgi:hypothetical protein